MAETKMYSCLLEQLVRPSPEIEWLLYSWVRCVSNITVHQLNVCEFIGHSLNNCCFTEPHCTLCAKHAEYDFLKITFYKITDHKGFNSSQQKGNNKSLGRECSEMKKRNPTVCSQLCKCVLWNVWPLNKATDLITVMFFSLGNAEDTFQRDLWQPPYCMSLMDILVGPFFEILLVWIRISGNAIDTCITTAIH